MQIIWLITQTDISICKNLKKNFKKKEKKKKKKNQEAV